MPGRNFDPLFVTKEDSAVARKKSEVWFSSGFASIWILFSISLVSIAAPVNDLCSGAETIPSSGPFPFYSSVTPDVSEATTSGDPPAPACVVGIPSRSVWYRFAPPLSGLYTLSVSGDTATTVPDTVVALYASASDCGGPFAQVACNDDAGGLRSAIATNLTAGTSYYIVVWVSPVSAPLTNGHGAVQLRISRPVVPLNDSCAGAELIPANGPFPYFTTVTDTTLAGTAGDPPASLCQTNLSRSVWYRFTPATTTTYTISTCTDTATTVYDTLIAVYSSASGCGGPFTAIACNDDACGFRAVVTTTLNAGVTYYIVASETGNEPSVPGETSLQLRVSGIFAPLVRSLPATSITSTSAVLNAEVNPSGAATTAWFDWGTTTNYSNSTPPQSLGSGTSNLEVNATLVGLSNNLSYFFRVRGTNVIGAGAGSNLNFAWSAARPAIHGVTRSTSGIVSLEFSGVVRQKYLVFASTNLTSWLMAGTATDEGNGEFGFVDANASGSSRRFYRVLAP